MKEYNNDPWLNAIKQQLTQLVAMQKRVESFHVKQQKEADNIQLKNTRAIEKLYGIVEHIQHSHEHQQQYFSSATETIEVRGKHLNTKFAAIALSIVMVPVIGLLSVYLYLGEAIIEQQATLTALQQNITKTPVVIEFEGKQWVKVEKGSESLLENDQGIAAYAKLSL